MRRREAAGAGDKRRRIDEIAQEGPLLNEIRCAVSQVSAGEMNASKWHNQILSIVLSSVTSTFANRVHMNVVPRSTMNTNGETEN